MTNLIDHFKTYMENFCLEINIPIIANGEFQRFHVEGDKPGSMNGWYVLDPNKKHGAFGNWKTGLKEKWNAKKELDNFLDQSDESQKNRVRIEKQELIRDRKNIQASNNAFYIWNISNEVISHPYCIKKRIMPLGIRQYNHSLIIPICDLSNTIWSIQFIDYYGNKKFLKNGKIKGNYFEVEGDISKIYICEGYATGITIKQKIALDKKVIVAFNTSNLKEVAIVLRNKYPSSEIVIAADNDNQSDINPGLTKAVEAAKAASATIIYPCFKNLNCKGTDFNDYFTVRGEI